MKKFLLCVLAGAMITATACTTGGQTPEGTTTESAEPNQTADEPAGEIIELTMGSWRADDVAQMNSLLAEYSKVAPNVKILFQPTNPPDYNATLRLQLEGDIGPDLMYARSYATGQELFTAGYFADVTDIPGLTDNFTATNLEPWRMPDGTMFAVPFAAVSHGVYYNKDIFAEHELEIPTTWEELMTVSQTLLDVGVTPFANGVGEEWDILECFFLGMLTNYVGGAENRVKYETGELPLNDENFVNAFTDLAQVSPFLPMGFEAVTYNDSQALFNSGGAAMFVDGSWTMGVYEGVTFDWGVFAVPGRTAEDTAVTFHPDMAITMNAATEHPEEVRAFLEWICSQEGATTASANLPVGYFPMINFPITIANTQANEFLSLNEGRVTDARFVWPALMDLYAPMNQEVISVLKGDQTPQAAADALEALMP